MMAMRWVGLFGCMSVILLIMGCSEPNTDSRGWGVSVSDISDDELREALGRIRSIPVHADERLDRAAGQLRTDGQLAEHLVNGPMEDDINARLIAYRAFTTAILDYHIDEFVKDRLTDERIREFHAEHANQFGKRRYRVAHVFIRASEGAASSTIEDARSRIETVHDQLESGADFQELVQARSEDVATRGNGGELGWLNEDGGHPDLVRVVSRMEPDEISEPVRTARGFHVLKLLEAPPVERLPYEQVKAEVRYRLREKLRNEALQRLRDEVAGEN